MPLAALLLAADGHDVVFAGICRADAVGRRRLRRRIGADRVVLRPDVARPAFAERLRALAPDLVVSWFWTSLVPPAVVATARWGGFGVHPSLLPRHRGPDPTYWTLDTGDVETGVTAHRLAAAYDTGAILGQERLAVDPRWNAWELARALDRPSLRLLRATVRRFAEGDPPPEIPQDEAAATAAPTPDDAEASLDFRWPTDALLRRIRALAPAPGAFFALGDVTVTVLRASPARAPLALRPGEAFADGDRVVVRTGDGAIEISAAEIDGHPAGPGALAARVRGSAG